MKKIILQTQKVFNGKYAFTLEVNFESVEQVEDIIYYVKTDNYSVYKHNAYWYIVDKITNIEYSEHKLVNKTQLKELTELIKQINKELNSDRVKGQTYYYIDSELIIRKTKDLFCVIDNTYYELGNYFTDKNKVQEIANKLKRFWNNIKEEKNTYVFKLSFNEYQINNIPSHIQGKFLDNVLKICRIADKRLIKFTLENGNIDQERGLKIEFEETMKLNGIENVKYVEIGEDYVYAWVYTLEKYKLLNL
jgi:hypothetical protein